MTCAAEVLHSAVDLLIEILRLDQEAVLEFFSLLLQHVFTVNQDLLEPHPIAIYNLTHLLHLWVNQLTSCNVVHV